MTSPALRLEGITKRYGDLTALDNVDLVVEQGARHAIIGPNGAGKSTLFAILAGATRPSGGHLWFGETDITHMPEHRRAIAGIARTFQHSSLFESATVAENVRIAAQRALGVASRPIRSGRSDRCVDRLANERLEAVDLADKAETPVAALGHGERRQLEVAVSLACQPSVLLFDEPTAGMSPSETDRFATLIESLSESVTVVFIEHDVDLVFRVATRVSVLHLGARLADGDPETVRHDAKVQEAYLGTSSLDELFTDVTDTTNPESRQT